MVLELVLLLRQRVSVDVTGLNVCSQGLWPEDSESIYSESSIYSPCFYMKWLPVFVGDLGYNAINKLVVSISEGHSKTTKGAILR